MKILVDMWVRTELIVEAEDGVSAYEKADQYVRNANNYIPKGEVVVSSALGHGAIRVYSTLTGESLYHYEEKKDGSFRIHLHGKFPHEKTNEVE